MLMLCVYMLRPVVDLEWAIGGGHKNLVGSKGHVKPFWHHTVWEPWSPQPSSGSATDNSCGVFTVLYPGRMLLYFNELYE